MVSPTRTYNNISEVHREDREHQVFDLNDKGEVVYRTKAELSFADVDAPEIIIVDAVGANIEVAKLLPDGAKKIKIRSRTVTRMRLAWEATETKDEGKYISIGQGGCYNLEGIKTKGNIVYLRTNKSNVKIEIEVWT